MCDPYAPQSLDGCCNNLRSPTAGAVGQQLRRVADTAYPGDGSGNVIADRPVDPLDSRVYPNARDISNIVAAQTEHVCSSFQLGEIATFFGQYHNHDQHEASRSDSPAEATFISVRPGDIIQSPIPVQRTNVVPGTGTSRTNPRQHANDGASMALDLSAVYGLSNRTLAAVRDGTSPFLRTKMFRYGEFPPPGEDVGFDVEPALTGLVAGDHRANENPGLLAQHTLWVRNHNWHANRLRRLYTVEERSDEAVFQAARRMNIAEFQKLVTHDWLRSLGVRLPRYTGYKPNVLGGPISSIEMLAGALRIGHTLLRDDFEFLDRSGQPISAPVALRDAFSRPNILTGGELPAGETPDEDAGGVDALVRAHVQRCANAIDTRVVDDVRTFLFGSAGLDLVVFNLVRGRDVGFPRYNEMRRAFGLPSVQEFSHIASDPETQRRLAAAYNTVDDIDYWIGGLAEDHIPGTTLGQLFTAVFQNHYQATRDGDRFWWEQPGVLDPTDYERDCELHREVAALDFGDFLARNTGLARSELPRNAFFVRGTPNAERDMSGM